VGARKAKRKGKELVVGTDELASLGCLAEESKRKPFVYRTTNHWLENVVSVTVCS
jgi:hypothetical protein